MVNTIDFGGRRDHDGKTMVITIVKRQQFKAAERLPHVIRMAAPGWLGELRTSRSEARLAAGSTQAVLGQERAVSICTPVPNQD
jgi:hypothetical protein